MAYRKLWWNWSVPLEFRTIVCWVQKRPLNHLVQWFFRTICLQEFRTAQDIVWKPLMYLLTQCYKRRSQGWRDSVSCVGLYKYLMETAWESLPFECMRSVSCCPGRGTRKGRELHIISLDLWSRNSPILSAYTLAAWLLVRADMKRDGWQVFHLGTALGNALFGCS